MENYMDIRDELVEKVREMMIEDVKPFWNSEWLDMVRALPEGPEKEAEKEKALQSIKSILDALARGEYEVVDGIDEDLIK